MRAIQIFLLRCRSLLVRRRVEHELDEELRFHIDHLIADEVAGGASLDQARLAVRREFGAVDRFKDACRDERGIAERAADVARDLRFAMRLWRRTPAFTAAAVLIVALAIGATTAMFSVVYGVMLRPLPFGDPDRLVQIWTRAPDFGLDRALVGAANYRDWRSATKTLDDIALVRAIGNFNLSGEGEPERLQGARISANLLPVLRIGPRLGRAFTEDEDEIGHDRVVLLSDALWKRRFGADPSILGREIRLNGEPYLVVGVMGPEFQYPSRQFELWTPLTIDPDDYQSRMNYGFLAIGRLEPGVSMAAARAEFDAIAAQLQQQYPVANRNIGVEIAPMLDDAVAPVRRGLYVLLGAVGVIVLIACANLANLLLARALARGHELTLRGALGASRARLVQQAMTEVVPIVVAGGVLGVLGASWTISSIVPILPPDLPRAEGIAVGWPVLLVSAAALLLVTLLTSVWPAIAAARMNLAQSLRESGRTTTSGRRALVRNALVVAQVALTLVLLVGASLLVRSFFALTGVEPGFRTAQVLSLHMAIPRTKYTDDSQVAAMCTRVLERVRGIAGVESVGMVNRLPLGGVAQIGGIDFEDGDPERVKNPPVDWRTVTPDYFRTLGIPILAGRAFTDVDAEQVPMVGIIDERLARAYFHDRDPIGHRFRIMPRFPWIRIVGVTGHVKHDALDQEQRPQVYWNYLQRAQDRMALVVKTRGRPEDLARDVIAAIRSVDPEQPVYDVRSMDAVVGRSLMQRWLQTVLLASFAAIALVLACLGVYGLASYAVGQRVREFGVRMALGASRTDIVSMVVRGALALGAGGALIGLAGALALARTLQTLVFAVGVFDVPSFLVSIVVLLVVAVLASAMPARRAASVDATVALRSE